MPTSARIGVAAIICLIALTVLQRTSLQIAAWQDSQPIASDLPVFIDLKPQALEALTFGHKAAYDDFLTLWTMHSMVDSAFAFHLEDWRDVVRRILVHEPRLETFYTFTCIASQVLKNDIDICVELTAIGLKVFPESWRIPVTQAYIYGVILKDKEKAGAFYRLAAAQPKCPPYVISAANYIAGDMSNADQVDIALKLMLDATDSADLESVVRRFKSPPPGAMESQP